jgi:hypothetical protein
MRDLARPTCPTCGAVVDDTTHPDTGLDLDPSEGDVSICFYCGAFGVFTGEGKATRMPTEAELLRFTSDPALVKWQRLLAAFKVAHPEVR